MNLKGTWGKLLAVIQFILVTVHISYGAAVNPTDTVTLTLGGYTTPREAYGKGIIPAFQQYWKSKTGQAVVFQDSYLGSGAQARAIIAGFEADVTALSLEGDIDKIAEAGLITHDWRAGLHKGIITRSIVVLAVRKGNPKGVKDWADLAKPGIAILMANPKTSGGAMWTVNAIYGSALRGGVTGIPKGDPAAVQAFLRSVLKNVTVMDKGARESITNFERGIGDVAITYENEVVVAKQAGETYEYVIPHSTILIENPVSVVDKWAQKHHTQEAAAGLVGFLETKESQRTFAKYGLRPVHPEVARELTALFPPVSDLWTIEFLGGWTKVFKDVYGPQGIYTQIMADLRK